MINDHTFRTVLLQQVRYNSSETPLLHRVSELRPGDIFGSPHLPSVVLATPGGIHAPSYERHTFRMLWTWTATELNARLPQALPMCLSYICWWTKRPRLIADEPGVFDGSVWHNLVPLIGRIPDFKLTPALLADIRASVQRDRRGVRAEALWDDYDDFQKTWNGVL